MRCRWMLSVILITVFSSCESRYEDSSKPLSALSITVIERPSGLWSSLFHSDEIIQRFYSDEKGRPSLAVYSRRGFDDERKSYEWTDTSVIIDEGRRGRAEYLLRDGLIVMRRSLSDGRTASYSYDEGRHIISAGQTDYVWQGSELVAVESKSPDGELMIEEQVSYDAQKPPSDVPMAAIICRRWGKWWLLPLLLKGYFGELTGDVPLKISHPDGHFDLFRSTFDDDGRLKSLQSVSDHETMTFEWKNNKE